MTEVPKPVTAHELLKMKERGERIVVLTCYDALFARLLDASDIDILLVGDSVNQVLAGAETTLSATLDQMLYHTRSVRRGAERAMVICDMPFLSYQVSKEEAIRNCGRVMAETGCHGVKLEGGRSMAETVRALVDRGIPVMGHLGLTPQSVHALGGYRVQGRDRDTAERLAHDAKALEEAGAFAIVLELIPAPLASQITRSVAIPTIGIGAAACFHPAHARAHQPAGHARLVARRAIARPAHRLRPHHGLPARRPPAARRSGETARRPRGAEQLREPAAVRPPGRLRVVPPRSRPRPQPRRPARRRLPLHPGGAGDVSHRAPGAHRPRPHGGATRRRHATGAFRGRSDGGGEAVPHRGARHRRVRPQGLPAGDAREPHGGRSRLRARDRYRSHRA